MTVIHGIGLVSGEPGFSGATGIQGLTGVQGSQGITGIRGSTGVWADSSVLTLTGADPAIRFGGNYLDFTGTLDAIHAINIMGANSFRPRLDMWPGFSRATGSPTIRLEAGTDVSYINSGGNVGIGVTAPLASLEVRSTAASATALLVSDTSAANMFDIYTATDSSGNRATVHRSSAGDMVVMPKAQTSSAIQAALDYVRNQGLSGTVHLPVGTYAMTSKITVPFRVRLTGSGELGTVLDGSTLEDDVVVTDSAAWDGTNSIAGYGVYVSNLRIIGNGKHVGLKVNGVFNSTFENLWFTTCKTGLHLKGWCNSVMNCSYINCFTGLDLSWPDTVNPERVNATNATAVVGGHYWCDDGYTPPSSIINTGTFSGGVATFTTTSAHRLQHGADTTVIGSSQASWNIPYRAVYVVDTTTFKAEPVSGIPTGSASDGTATGRLIGVYVNGLVNSITGTTIEIDYDATPYNSAGIYLNARMALGCPTTVSGCYFENWKNTFVLDGSTYGCGAVSLVGNGYTTLAGNEAVVYYGVKNDVRFFGNSLNWVPYDSSVVHLGEDSEIRWKLHNLNLVGGDDLIHVVNLMGAPSWAPRIDVWDGTSTVGNPAIRFEAGISGSGFINNAGPFGFGTAAPTSRVDSSGSGYSQLRLRTSYTPSGTADGNGNTGDYAWDDSYLYVKTSAGWKRSGLTTF